MSYESKLLHSRSFYLEFLEFPKTIIMIRASFFNKDNFLVVSLNDVLFLQELWIQRVSFVFLI